jgi:hypothetical protein
MSTNSHRSTAYIKPINERGRAGKPDPITSQFRFIVRMAYACHAQNVPYDLTWNRRDSQMAATITANGNIPMPKPLPKPPKSKPVSDWKPSIWDAAYRLDAYQDVNLKRRCPGFVIEHSCGLSLVHPSDSDELGGLGFGLTLNFKRATDALLLAASFQVDWTRDAEVLKADLEIRRAGNTVLATYGNGSDRDSAKRRLAELERAA